MTINTTTKHIKAIEKAIDNIKFDIVAYYDIIEEAYYLKTYNNGHNTIIITVSEKYGVYILRLKDGKLVSCRDLGKFYDHFFIF